MRKRDTRIAQVMRLVHVSAGGGVPPDRRRTAPEAGGQGETQGGSPTRKTYLFFTIILDNLLITLLRLHTGERRNGLFVFD